MEAERRRAAGPAARSERLASLVIEIRGKKRAGKASTFHEKFARPNFPVFKRLQQRHRGRGWEGHLHSVYCRILFQTETVAFELSASSESIWGIFGKNVIFCRLGSGRPVCITYRGAASRGC
jgi:hypothetical protein